MITIEQLEMIFDAENDGDEAVFARLFERHMTRHEAARRVARDDAQKADRDRSLHTRRNW